MLSCSHTADRLRAVILTTLTTVLGLAPLLYETSNQAQFLKPTVITLVYGLGFGLVLVLLVVPALLAIGHDFGRTFRAARRASSGRAPGMQGVLGGVGICALAWFAATMGSVIVTGSMPALLGASGSMALAFLAFVAGVAAIVFVGWLLAALRFSRRLRA